MNQAIRSVRAQPPAIFSSSLQSSFGHKTSAVSFRRVVTSSSSAPANMDKDKNQEEKSGNLMSHSFGEGYATRSDEEGFGGIYGRNESSPDIENDKVIHENHPAFDKNQGSEVKEKEKGRHQPESSN